jgi:hypothetical protein
MKSLAAAFFLTVLLFVSLPGSGSPEARGADPPAGDRLLDLYTVSGRVTDTASKPIPDAKVTFCTGQSVITDGDGFFTISDLAAGTYELVPSKAGYSFSPAYRMITVPPSTSGVNFTGTPRLDLAIEGPLEVASKHSPFKPGELTLEVKAKNLSGSLPVSSVLVNFYDGNPALGGTLIASAWAGDLQPGESRAVQVQWGLPGNIENRSIYAQVTTSATIQDPYPGNNTVQSKISVYFTGFRHDRDAYSFYNAEVGVISDNDILAFLADFDIPELLARPTLPIFGLLFEMNGYCYGMSNSSLVYFENPALKPVPGISTFDHSLLDARAKVRTYQWYAVEPSLRAIMGLEPSDPAEQYDLTLSSIKQGKPVMHALMARSGWQVEKGSHAVVAYKIVDLGDEKRVYYYDNNFPLKALKPAGQETYGSFNSSGFSEPFYSQMNPAYHFNKAYVFSPRLSYSDGLRSLLLELSKWVMGQLFSDEKMVLTTTGTADLLAVDSQGRPAGYQAGGEYSEIPGSTVTRLDGLQSLILPSGDSYQIKIVSPLAAVEMGSGRLGAEEYFTFDLILPEAPAAARIVQFKEISLAAGEMAKMEIGPALDQPRLEMPGGESLLPSVDQVVSAVQPVFLPLVALGQPSLR